MQGNREAGGQLGSAAMDWSEYVPDQMDDRSWPGSQVVFCFLFFVFRDREPSVLYFQSVRPWMRFPRMSRAFYR